jgi:hypothetical protein
MIIYINQMYFYENYFRKKPYDAFYGFPGNPIKPRYERLSVGEAHPSHRHTGYISRCGYHGAHTLKAFLSIYLLDLSWLGLIEFPAKP